MKCRECEFASVHTYPRNGNSNSAHVGHFGQEASFCNHPQCPPPGPLLFYGKTAPRYCPLRKKVKIHELSTESCSLPPENGRKKHSTNPGGMQRARLDLPGL